MLDSQALETHDSGGWVEPPSRSANHLWQGIVLSQSRRIARAGFQIPDAGFHPPNAWNASAPAP